MWRDAAARTSSIAFFIFTLLLPSRMLAFLWRILIFGSRPGMAKITFHLGLKEMESVQIRLQPCFLLNIRPVLLAWTATPEPKGVVIAIAGVGFLLGLLLWCSGSSRRF
jgi:hypothetical protein